MDEERTSLIAFELMSRITDNTLNAGNALLPEEDGGRRFREARVIIAQCPHWVGSYKAMGGGGMSGALTAGLHLACYALAVYQVRLEEKLEEKDEKAE